MICQSISDIKSNPYLIQHNASHIGTNTSYNNRKGYTFSWMFAPTFILNAIFISLFLFFSLEAWGYKKGFLLLALFPFRRRKNRIVQTEKKRDQKLFGYAYSAEKGNFRLNFRVYSEYEVSPKRNTVLILLF